MKKIDLTGKRFGYLTVIEEHGHKHQHIAWLCKCDCGKEKITIGSSLRKGRVRSCGSCINSENAKKKIKEEKTRCLCCGKEFISRGFFNVKQTCSEECKRLRDLEQIHKRSRKDFKHVLMQSLYRMKSKSNRRRNCNLTIDFLVNMLEKQNNKCAKTGIPFEISTGRGINGRSPWSISVDQIIPNKGYTKDNIQLVCLMYNLCKGVWSEDKVKQFTKAIRDYE